MEALSSPWTPVKPAEIVADPVNDSHVFEQEAFGPGPAPSELLPALDDEQTVLSLYPWLD